MASADVLESQDIDDEVLSAEDNAFVKRFVESYKQSFDPTKCHSLEEGLAILHAREAARSSVNA